MNIYDYMKDSIPNDTSEQYSAVKMVTKLLKTGFTPKSILDFGCGVGSSVSLFTKLCPTATWTGLDVESSPEVDARKDNNGEFVTYDGLIVPFRNSSFDLIYSHQVLEHVENPIVSFAEVYRVLSRGGYFCGQTSQFEAYHSHSTINYTLYGFKKFVTAAGFTLVEFRPGIDAFTLLERSYMNKKNELNRYFSEESPNNMVIEDGAKDKSYRIRNFRKLMYCGQFVFLCKKD